ncbi:MAG: hypothetical protein BGO78_00530 [Chloroflexi bacterium 44-23]|nr:MAG: hypothetical protein BGO78_00530 [Chloroflexi bacterium 44-23]
MTNHPDFYAVIMAGGGGTRLWPLSRKSTPKQVVNITGDKSLFQLSVNRLKGLFDNDHVFVVTIADQVELLSQQASHIPIENFLIEPFPRGTASVVGLAAIHLDVFQPEAVMAILTADHFIENEEEFRNLLNHGYLAAKQGNLVTIGIQPTYPATGFGYIQHDQPLAGFAEGRTYSVKKFKEKPKEEEARLFINNGDHDWNSGMFIWSVSSILAEFKRQMPGLNAILTTLQQAIRENKLKEVILDEWRRIEPETIDYGIMEHANHIIVLRAVNLGWKDVGSWESLFEVLPADKTGTIVIGANHVGFETENSLVYSQTPEKLIVTIGVKDTIIVDVGNVMLVCHRDQAQDVKKIVNYLSEKGLQSFL